MASLSKSYKWLDWIFSDNQQNQKEIFKGSLSLKWKASSRHQSLPQSGFDDHFFFFLLGSHSAAGSFAVAVFPECTCVHVAVVHPRVRASLLQQTLSEVFSVSVEELEAGSRSLDRDKALSAVSLWSRVQLKERESLFGRVVPYRSESTFRMQRR